MNKLDTFLSKHGSKIIIVLLVAHLYVEITQLNRIIITEEVMIDLIKTVPAWKTLRIEEISDKERISINALEQKEN